MSGIDETPAVVSLDQRGEKYEVEHSEDRRVRLRETKADGDHRRRKDWLVIRASTALLFGLLLVCTTIALGFFHATDDSRKEAVGVITHGIGLLFGFIGGRKIQEQQGS